jgi:hypothetical protein
VSSGERKRMRLNLLRVIAGGRCVMGVVGALGRLCRGGEELQSLVVAEQSGKSGRSG